ncbi:MAG: sulfatase [Planctomycetes bacterium]|nr:sulfatase [Planctomycetota bacterium]
MKAIMLMYDSLNRHMLPPYGCAWTKAPNFARLAKRAATFDRSYIASMPCMPARRDWHTGRPNFLHRSWGPLEPYDDSTPELLKKAGVYTHLASDHYHYWEDGGASYHGRYTTWEFFRGQEGDPWYGQTSEPEEPEAVCGADRKGSPHWRQDWINRSVIREESQWPQSQTFTAGLDFIRRNQKDDRWFLHMETFDPHEPFYAHEKYRRLYPHTYNGPHFDWPPYRAVTEPPEQVEHCRYEYAALLSQCDANLGRLLDLMDELDLWQDTMLVVWTDHGFMLGEHGCWAKMWQPWYEELSHTPFFVWDPRPAKQGIQIAGTRRQTLVQPALDMGPTLLDFFGIEPTADMTGRPLRDAIASDKPVRDAALFGQFGSGVNVTDGQYVYMRRPVAEAAHNINRYWLMPSHMRGPFTLQDLRGAAIAGPFSFTKGANVIRTPVVHDNWTRPDPQPSILYDLQSDPEQSATITDPAIERVMIDHMVRLMESCDAPPEQYERLGLRGPSWQSSAENICPTPSDNDGPGPIQDCRHLSRP